MIDIKKMLKQDIAKDLIVNCICQEGKCPSNYGMNDKYDSNMCFNEFDYKHDCYECFETAFGEMFDSYNI